MIQLLPAEERADPLADTWRRGLIATALEIGMRPLCWHIEHKERGSVATGYVTTSLQHDADSIRASWAQHLDLKNDEAGGWIGESSGLTVALPSAIDPDEHCQVCGRAFDPRDLSHTGRARYNSGDVCRSCMSMGEAPDGSLHSDTDISRAAERFDQLADELDPSTAAIERPGETTK